MAVNCVAVSLFAQGKYAQAQPLFEKALAIYLRLIADHQSTATCYNNLAANLDAQGKYAEAPPLLEKALEIRRRCRLGEMDPDTVLTLENVAINLSHQGKYAEAQPLYEKAVGILRRDLIAGHPLVAKVADEASANLEAQDNDPDARDRRERAVKKLNAIRLGVAFIGP